MLKIYQDMIRTICFARVISSIVYSSSANGEGGLQAAARHALDVDQVDVLEGHPPAIRQSEWPAALFERSLHQPRQHRRRSGVFYSRDENVSPVRA